MLLLQNWFGLSDEQVEQQLNDKISFNKLCGLSLEDIVPDATVLCRYRIALSENNIFENLLNIINQQLEKQGVIITQGLIIDASITDTLHKPKGKKVYEIIEYRNKENTDTTVVLQQKSKNTYEPSYNNFDEAFLASHSVIVPFPDSAN